jgi:putative DNA primase/helicase
VALKFEDVAQAALADAPLLLAQWLGGGRKGHEWLGERKANGGLGDSWSVNLNTGAFAHFGGTEKGGDLVALYAALNHLDQLAALKQVAAMVGVTNGARAPVKLPRAAPPESPCEPIPDDAPDLKAHTEHGVAAAVYRYGRAFWIARYDTPKGKVFSQHTWRNGKWWAKGYTGLKPLYRAELLPKHPEAPVLIVEGEKCVEAAGILKKYIAMTWAGGAQTVAQSDWSALAARDVIIWPDADDPGRTAAAKIAAILEPIAKRVRVIAPNGQALGWDIADAVAEGMDRHAIAKWAGEHITDKISAPASAAAAELPPETSPTEAPKEVSVAATAESATQEFLPVSERERDEDYPDGQPPKSSIIQWQHLALAKDSKDVPHVNMANASIILRFHEHFAGKIWLDTFRDKIYHTLTGAARVWTDADARRVTAFIQQSLNLPKFTSLSVHEAAQHAAECNPHNSVVEWLESLTWDGTSRIDTWLSDTLEVEHTDYTMSVAKNWLIGMVNRAYVPGCKMDNMPVLEGPQGLRKTSFLEVLGGEWYKSLPMQFGEKDFLQAIQGAWLIEIPDMTGFSRREHSSIISTITIKTDEYRKSYGRQVESHPRTAVFSATSERDNYLSDTRGRRRYWPLRCKKIHLDVLIAQRDQLFAEAVSLYKRGESHWEMPDTADVEQRARAEPDPWAEKVVYTAEQYFTAAQCDLFKAKITASFLLEQLGVHVKDQSQKERNRVSDILENNEWKSHRTTNARLWYKPALVTDKSSRWSS